LRGELGVCLISWVGVWELLCNICIALLYAFLAFGIAYVTWCIGIFVSWVACILYHMHSLGKASPINIVHHGMLCMCLWACSVSYGLFGLALDNLDLYPWLMAMFFKKVTYMLSCE
jgi:hypothetical protein